MELLDFRPPKTFGTYNWYIPTTGTSQSFGLTDWYNVPTAEPAVPLTGEMLYASSSRWNKSSNRRRLISGTGTPWIAPSDYDRAILHVDCTNFQHFTKHAFGTRWVWEPFGTVQMGWKTGEVRYTSGGHGESLYHALGRGISPLFWFNHDVKDPPSNKVNQAATECLLKIKDQKVNIGENLATLKQTATMFSKNAVQIARALRSLRSGNWGAAFSAVGLNPKRPGRIKRASDRYLEWLYGWKPLVGDTYGLYELLKEQAKPALFVHAVRNLTWGEGDSPEPWDDISYDRRWTRSNNFTCHLKYSLTGMITDGLARDLARAGLINPLSVAWEVVPYSFLVDWALPIGNVLSALDATRGLDFIGGYWSYTVKGDSSLECRMVPESGSSYYVNHQVGMFKIKQLNFRRRRIHDWPSPLPYFKSPFSDSHLITASALFGARTRNGRF